MPLREGVYFEGAAIFNDGTVNWIQSESGVDAVDLALDTIRQGGQVLLFVNTRKSAEATAARAASAIRNALPDTDRTELASMAEKALSRSSEQTRLSKKLFGLLPHGVAFHHAGILTSDRRIIEDAFREGSVKFLAATTTLAMGLNLPSRRVIIRDWRRFESGSGMVPIPVMEVKQMAGRAGRPGLDAYGEAVLIAGNKHDERVLFERYIKGRAEDVTSGLGTEQALRIHTLAAIAGGFADSRADLLEFLEQTLYARQSGVREISAITDKVLEFLVREALVTGKDGLAATRFGRRVSELYIDPLTGVLLRTGLSFDREKTSFGLLHMITTVPDMPGISLKQADIDRMLAVYSRENDRLLGTYPAIPTEDMLSQVKLASLISEWINEMPEDDLSASFGVGPGDIHTYVDMADWLLYSSFEIARIFKHADAEQALEPLRMRVQYGVRAELLPLVSLKGIGRKRARNLFNAGFKTARDIADADLRDLEKVPAIGKTIAEDIRKQVSGEAAA